MPEVKCSVNTCMFYAEGDRCEADSIWVMDNQGENDDLDLLDVEFSDEIGSKVENREQKPRTKVNSSRQTCCKTMRPKDR